MARVSGRGEARPPLRRWAWPVATLLAAGLLLLPAGPVGVGGGAPAPADPVGASHATSWGKGGGAVPDFSQQLLAWSPNPSSYLVGEGGGLAASADGTSAVLFGGYTSTLTNTTAVYNETLNTWTGPLTTNGHAPSPRSHFAFGGDPVLGEDVLFGGETNVAGAFTDNGTWVYYPANDTWRDVTHTVAPAPRQDAAFALAPYVGTGLLFGGWNQSYGGSGVLIYADTWTLDLADNLWTPVTFGLGGHPPNLHGASLLWDPAVHRFELFGGCDPCSSALWRYDPWNSTWSQVATSGTPVGREGAAWEYDPVDGLDLLFGGENSNGVLSDTWTFDPGRLGWVLDQSAPSPSGRYASGSTWLDAPTNETLLLVGGNNGLGPLNDAWRLAPTSTVDVRVLDASTHLPLPSATVTVDQSPQITTDLLGYGNVSMVPPGGTSIMGSKVGYRSSNASLWVEPGITPPLVVLNLTPNPQANLTVRVLAPSGTPLAGIDVNVSVLGKLWRNPPLTTGSQGYVYYVDVPAGTPLAVSAWQQGFHTNRTVLTLAARANLSFVFTLYELPHLVLRTWANDTAVPPGAFGYPNAWVWLNGSVYGLSGAGGWVNVTLNRTGGLRFEATVVNSRAGFDNVSLPYSGTVWGNATVYPYVASGLFVHVIDNATRSGLPGANVNDSFSNGLQVLQSFTDAHGDSNSSFLRAGPNVVRVWAPGYYEQVFGAFVVPGGALFLNVSLVSLPVLHLRTYGVDVHNRTVVLPGVSVYWNGAFSGVTGPGGWLNYTPARAGQVLFFAYLVDYRPGWLNHTVNATGVQWANMTLVHEPWSVLAVQVLDRANGLPLPGAMVTATMPDGSQNQSLAGPHGYANMTSIVGTAEALATFADFYPAGGLATLVAYAHVPLLLLAVPYPVVHLRVLGENSTAPPRPLAGAGIEFNGTVVGYTNVLGYLNVSSYPGGQVVMLATSGLYIPEPRVEHLNYTGELNVTFVLTERPLSAVKVRVFDAFTGLPVPFALVNLTNLDPLPTTYGADQLTNRSGWTNFTQLGLGNYSLTSYHTGYHVRTYTNGPTASLFLSWGRTVWVNLTMVPLPWCYTFAMVKDRNTTQPVQGAEVLVGFSYAAYTNSLGNATFQPPFVPGGYYEVIATAPGYYAWESLWNFPIGRHTTLNIFLLPEPKKNCSSSSQPPCQPSNSGHYTKGNFSLLPFASGPWWPFFVLVPVFVLGALAYFALTRRRREGGRPPGVVVVPSAPAMAGPPPSGPSGPSG